MKKTNQNQKKPQRKLAIALVISWALVLSGCGIIQDMTGQAPPTQDDQDDGADTSKTLESGGQAVAGGVHVMAPEGALDTSVPVSIGKTSDPTSTTPLPQEATAQGNYYQVSAGQNLDIPSEKSSLFLALPVPDGVDVGNLGIAVRIPRKHLPGDRLSPSTTHVWSILPGAYHPNAQKLVTPIRSLSKTGNVFALVESADYDSPSMSRSGQVDSQGLAKDAVNFFTQGLKKREDFFIKCRGFNGGCGSNAKQAVREYLTKVYEDFRPEFNKPDLRRTLPGRKVNGKQGRYYLYIIRKDGTGVCSDAGGMYISPSNTGVTCYDGSGSPAEDTTRMEFFHAIQYNYSPVSWSKAPPKYNPQQHDWIVEGTAQFVESTKSNASNAHRLEEENLRNIDTPLTKQTDINNDPDPAYNVQDFWVYLINSRNSTPEEILEDVFGKQNSAINGLGPKKVDTLFGLASAHWGWVQNQAFESRVTAGNPQLNGTCVFNRDEAVSSTETITYDAASRSDPLQSSFSVDELTARVIEVKLQNKGTSKPVMAEVTATSSGNRHNTKVYRDYSSSSSECLYNNRSTPTTRDVVISQGTTGMAYVLISNSHYSGGKATVDVKVQQKDISVDITNPSDGASFTEGSLVEPKANVKLPSKYNYDLTWSTDGKYEGTGSIPSIGTRLLCRGSHTLTVEMTVPKLNVTLSDQVNIRIKNVQPSVSITQKEPSDGTIPQGSPLMLQAQATDQTCTGDTATEKIAWFVNGQQVKEDHGPSVPVFHTVNAAVGSQVTVQAQYTDDSGATATTERLIFTVTPQPQGNQPPKAQIIKPSPAYDLYQTLFLPVLEAKAIDPDGSIEKYEWAVTQRKFESDDEFKTITFTGKRVDDSKHLWQDYGFAPGTFRIELTVTDDKGAQTTESVDIEIGPGG